MSRIVIFDESTFPNHTTDTSLSPSQSSVSNTSSKIPTVSFPDTIEFLFPHDTTNHPHVTICTNFSIYEISEEQSLKDPSFDASPRIHAPPIGVISHESQLPVLSLGPVPISSTGQVTKSIQTNFAHAASPAAVASPTAFSTPVITFALPSQLPSKVSTPLIPTSGNTQNMRTREKSGIRKPKAYLAT
uniref:Uncharacterized protein n=1 Tax=Cannabis sativa TaxID=3483 RepID=A0A803Q6C6_CANSA